MPRSLKNELKQALLAGDHARVAELAIADKRTFGKLVALAYNKDELLCWRAIEAIGAAAAAVAKEDQASVRNAVQRILWSAREESGGMGWSAPELLAEIAIAAPRYFPDIPPIIISLHSEDEERVFLKGSSPGRRKNGRSRHYRHSQAATGLSGIPWEMKTRGQGNGCLGCVARRSQCQGSHRRPDRR